jgi:hypothetical protein
LVLRVGLGNLVDFDEARRRKRIVSGGGEENG